MVAEAERGAVARGRQPLTVGGRDREDVAGAPGVDREQSDAEVGELLGERGRVDPASREHEGDLRDGDRGGHAVGGPEGFLDLVGGGLAEQVRDQRGRVEHELRTGDVGVTGHYISHVALCPAASPSGPVSGATCRSRVAIPRFSSRKRRVSVPSAGRAAP